MSKFSNNELADGKFTSWYAIPVLVILVLVGLFVGQGIGVVFTILTSHISLSQIPYLVSAPFTDEKRVPIYLLQGLGTLVGFVIIGLVYVRYLEQVRPARLYRFTGDPAIIMISALMVVSFMFANSFLIDWNSNIHFPGDLHGFESWARAKEDELKVVTDFLTQFKGTGDFLLGFVVIVLIPAFGEELLFRGIIQNKLENIFKNGHVAIWLAAFLFSAFHFQFFGFVPRMMLGVLFGYMYYWSRSLWYPVMAHFLNNGITLVMIYLYDLKVVNVNIQEDQSYSWYTTLIFAFIGFVLLFYFRQYFIQKQQVAANE